MIQFFDVNSIILEKKRKKNPLQNIVMKKNFPLQKFQTIQSAQRFFNRKTWTEKVKSPKFQEQRRRFQFYANLDLLSSNYSVFDMMNPDSIRILLKARQISDYLQFKEVTPEVLTLACLFGKASIRRLFQKVGLDSKSFVRNFLKKHKITENFLFKVFFFFRKSFKFFQKNILFQKRKSRLEQKPFSKKTFHIFLKAAQNTYRRFKTFVITPEILFLTLMEDKKTFFLATLQSKENWDIVHARLCSTIHLEDRNLFFESPKEYYYAYLLKIKMKQKLFRSSVLYELFDKENNLIFLDENPISMNYREAIYEKVLQWNRLKYLEFQTKQTQKLVQNFRKKKITEKKV